MIPSSADSTSDPSTTETRAQAHSNEMRVWVRAKGIFLLIKTLKFSDTLMFLLIIWLISSHAQYIVWCLVYVDMIFFLICCVDLLLDQSVFGDTDETEIDMICYWSYFDYKAGKRIRCWWHVKVNVLFFQSFILSHHNFHSSGYSIFYSSLSQSWADWLTDWLTEVLKDGDGGATVFYRLPPLLWVDR